MSTAKTGFEALVDELALGDLAKAIPAAADEGAGEDDAAIAAAAADGDAADGDDDDNTEAKPFGKSFKVTLEDGTEVEALDGADLVKSLVDRVETNETTTLAALKSLADVVKPALDLVKSLRAEVAALSNSGKGRKAVIAIVEKPASAVELAAAAAEPAGMTGEAFMAKAMQLSASGALTGREVAIAESHINMGEQPPVEIVRKVVAAS